MFTLCAPDGAFLAQRRAPGAGRPRRRRRSTGWRRTPTARRSLSGTGPVPDRQVDAGRERPARPRRGRGLAPGDGAHARAHLGGRPDPADDRRSSRRPSTGSTPRARRPRPDRDAARARRHAARRARDRLPRVRHRRRPGQGRASGARIAGALDRDTLAADGVRRRLEGGDPRRRRARSTAAAAATTGTASTPRRRAQRSTRPSSTSRQTYRLHIPDGRCRACRTRPASPRRSRRSSRPTSGCRPRSTRCPSATTIDDLATGKLDGLYLGGVASTRRDPGAFLGPLFGAGVRSTPAARAPKAAAAIEDAAATADPPSAPTRSAAPTTRSATPPPSSRSPTRARSPRSAPT